MEKILQILAVFALLMLVITWFFRDREFKLRDYVFSYRFRGSLPTGIRQRMLSGVVSPVEEGEPVQAIDHQVQVTDHENGLIFRRGPDMVRALEIADEQTGLIVSTTEIIDTVDAILFDPATRLIYCYGASGSITIVRQSGRDNYRIEQTLAAPVNGAVLSLDPKDKKIYLDAGGSYFVFAMS
jgi:hypothetical protein